MRRRALLAGSAALAGAAQAQRAGEPLPMPPGGRPWRVGWLQIWSDSPWSRRFMGAFHAAMRERGWQLDRHYAVGERW